MTEPRPRLEVATGHELDAICHPVKRLEGQPCAEFREFFKQIRVLRFHEYAKLRRVGTYVSPKFEFAGAKILEWRAQKISALEADFPEFKTTYEAMQ